jgi:hypothetical protein
MSNVSNYDEDTLTGDEPDILEVKFTLKMKSEQRRILAQVVECEQTAAAEIFRQHIKRLALRHGLLDKAQADNIFSEVPGKGNRTKRHLLLPQE